MGRFMFMDNLYFYCAYVGVYNLWKAQCTEWKNINILKELLIISQNA